MLIWSRGEELITDRFPEVADAGRLLPEGTVIDGEIMAWRNDEPLPFAVLQRRIGRNSVDAKLLASVAGARGVRSAGSRRRRRSHCTVGRGADAAGADGGRRTWGFRAACFTFGPRGKLGGRLRVRTESRTAAGRGPDAQAPAPPYGVGRPKRGLVEVEDRTLLARCRDDLRPARDMASRASLYTDYTFGVWHEGHWSPSPKPTPA